MENPVYLFSYGTLQLESVQQATFGRLLDGADDAMPGYRTDMLEITDPEVLKTSGERFHPVVSPSDDPADRVTGRLFTLTAEELAHADRYEVADYKRVRVTLASGIDAWVYVKAEVGAAEVDRLTALVAAEDKALALLDAIEAAGLLAPGRTEREIEKDIYAMAEKDFGVEVHWHKRIVRSGVNTLAIFSDNPPILTVQADDIVFLDIGPVFEAWEADVGRTYAIGTDPVKQALVRDQSIIFDAVKAVFDATPDITGAELYAVAVAESETRGWRFAGEIAGHIVAEFPHARLPGEKLHGHIRPENPTRMRDPDGLGRERYWILEIHLAAPDGTFGGFYERLLHRA